MQVSGVRVELRPLAANDFPGILESMPPMHEGAEAVTILRADNPRPIGLIQYLPSHRNDGWLTIRFIELAPQFRGWGYGSEAVQLLEAEAILSGITQGLQALVPTHNGLALYFWLRMGYRPAAPGDAFWRFEDGDATMAMIRVH